MTTEIKSNNDLLSYLLEQSLQFPKKWYGFSQQKLTGVTLCHAIAANHADVMTPNEIVEYVIALNNSIHNNLITKG